MILPNRIEAENMSLNKEHTMPIHNPRNILGYKKNNVQDNVSSEIV